MPYLQTIQEWQQQSSLLLKARPSTARITTKYKILPQQSAKPKKRKTTTAEDAPLAVGDSGDATQQPVVQRGTLVFKTYDPVSGVCLKYRTDKAAEVNRLFASLGKLGRNMAALADMEDTAPDVPKEPVPTNQIPGSGTLAVEIEKEGAGTSTEAKAGQAVEGTKKRKKGKR